MTDYMSVEHDMRERGYVPDPYTGEWVRLPQAYQLNKKRKPAAAPEPGRATSPSADFDDGAAAAIILGETQDAADR